MTRGRGAAAGLAGLLGALALPLLAGCPGVAFTFTPPDGADKASDGSAVEVDGSPLPTPDAASSPDAPVTCNNPLVCSCNGDLNCRTSSNGNTCDLVSHQCVDCVRNSDCNSQRCVSFQCVRPCDSTLRDGGQCGGSFHCGPASFCVQCESMGDCLGDPTQPMCNPSTGRCVECVTASDCGGNGMGCSLNGRCFDNTFGPPLGGFAGGDASGLGSSSGGPSSAAGHDP